jgi:hypothetical protein
MVIGITINNVLRDHISKLESVYTAVTGDEPQHPPVNPYELDKHFPPVQMVKEENTFDENQVAYQHDENYLEEFKETDADFDVYQLMYVDGSFEVFGSADETEPGIIKKISDLPRDKHQVIITNLESSRSKCATLFFLSKNFFNLPELYFPDTREQMWDKFDVIVTDDPKILNIKPEGKKTIKVENNFNTTIDSDHTITNIKELVENFDTIMDKISALPETVWPSKIKKVEPPQS